MTKANDRLEEILGIRESGGNTLDEQLDSLNDEGVRESFPVVTYQDVPSKVETANVNEDALEDYKYTRTVMYGLISRGMSALEEALVVAKESENPRAYETASNLMRNVSDMTKDLLNLQKALNPPKANGKVSAETINVQNNNNTYIQKTEDENPNSEIFDILDTLGEDENGGSN